MKEVDKELIVYFDFPVMDSCGKIYDKRFYLDEDFTFTGLICYTNINRNTHISKEVVVKLKYKKYQQPKDLKDRILDFFGFLNKDMLIETIEEEVTCWVPETAFNVIERIYYSCDKE